MRFIHIHGVFQSGPQILAQCSNQDTGRSARHIWLSYYFFVDQYVLGIFLNWIDDSTTAELESNEAYFHKTNWRSSKVNMPRLNDWFGNCNVNGCG